MQDVGVGEIGGVLELAAHLGVRVLSPPRRSNAGGVRVGDEASLHEWALSAAT